MRALCVISFTLCGLATITSCPRAAICRLTHGECVPTSSATRLDAIFPNNDFNPAGVVGNYGLNNRGDVSFNASLENDESAFYVYSQRELHLVAGTGTVISGVGTVSSVTNFLANGGILNDSGQIFFWATMTDGKGVLLLATPSAVPQ